MGEPLISYDWCRETGGALTPAQRRTLLLRSLRTYGAQVKDIARLASGRRSTEPVRLPTAPDGAVIDAAVEAARDQGPDIEGHGFRTWLFGGALADRDGVDLDPELFCVAAIVHDAGGAQAVGGEDFTIRSADIAMAALDLHGGDFSADRRTALRDGIVAHATAGVRPDESAIGAYVQAGALLDLAGMRITDLPGDTIREVFQRHPAGTVKQTIVRVIDEEARAVPEGRFALSRRLGLALAVRASPTLRR